MYRPYPVAASVAGIFKNCYFTSSGGNGLLKPLDGLLLTMDGIGYPIPTAGVTLAPAGLSAGTVYYVYAYMASGVLTLEASATAPVQRNDNGMMAKTGQLERTLVGKIYPSGAGPLIQDTSAIVGVLSYFNRRPKVTQGVQVANYSTISSPLVEMSTDLRAHFIYWNDDVAICSANGMANQSLNNAVAQFAIGMPGAGGFVECHNLFQPAAAGGYNETFALSGILQLSGYSPTALLYTSLYGAAAGSGTMGVNMLTGGTGGRGCNRVTVMG